jgi:hypothetical protein
MPLSEATPMPQSKRASRSPVPRVCVLLATLVLGLTCLLPTASAQDMDSATPGSARTRSRLSSADPLNGGFLLVNMHGMLFHPALSDVEEDVGYARWLGSGVIRVFATDNNGLLDWDGVRVGNRIADAAPSLRAAHVQLIVALVNNHRQVPHELASNSGWMDNYWQLLLPFYTSDWRDAYLTFVRGLITTVQARGARDVIFAWELGNELHTPGEPEALMTFINQAVAEVRALDRVTPILPGTMGANHVEPGNRQSPIARWLYCDAPVDAYTLHAYDFVSRDRPGDMPIDWDLDGITAQPCPDGRSLPVIVEELGTSRSLPGVYSADDQPGRLQQEIRQIEFVRQFRQVIGLGVWNGESPRLVDRTFVDTRRGLTSYGSQTQGGGSCYDPAPDPAPGARCLLEQALRGIRFVRVDATDQWTPESATDEANPLVGWVDPVSKDFTKDAIAITGWVTDPSDPATLTVDTLGAFLGDTPSAGGLLAAAQLGMPSGDVPGDTGPAASASARFALTVPLSRLSAGTNVLTLAATSLQRGTWQTTLQVVMPRLGPIVAAAPRPAPVVVPIAAMAPRPRMEIQAPPPDADVPRHFTVDVLAPGADRIDVFLDPGRDHGGRLAGSTSTGRLPDGTFEVPVSASSGPQSIYVHAHYASAPEEVVSLPLTVD